MAATKRNLLSQLRRKKKVKEALHKMRLKKPNYSLAKKLIDNWSLPEEEKPPK